SLAAACGLARKPVGPVRRAAGGMRLLERAVREAIAVANSRGVALGDEDARRALGFIETLPDPLQPSLLTDLQEGRPTEIEHLSGAISRLAALAGVETPVHDTAYAALSA